ncbi:MULTISPECIES: N-acetyl-gamma-glutamyl-phosphate reductase [Streptomyces]|uniref:N-acetyl-gamma-glutamyl-phosphate reductase n=1 Tax=Streptomyces TaxID=1883 RepID=UPI0013A8C95A|nr:MULTISPECIES: N-acetyl-gamma-glutamyl-phosphate reductase [Streptomyces]MYS47849.1 N-acetyl-gamma-glutamyl-phosphate reductase [Streptomyces sp. SID5998]MYX42385.1 N-acetyl-gamma-glutamyl-phosphate reductase [Streptomyces sp. SID89]NED76417.1 N-acetyl-gamma-glutamyl-phosphate reductase [Streptomyces sp. SID9944]MBY8869541.1 N-acetyl-gamma-glutamyl-phosphate reductase [Streptomyces sennicomposti]NMO37012.1 N-acetyl-gamma-glutamyl-phosphate reductase [Streptomyces sp. GMY02]
MRATVIGAGGYIGGELVRLLLQHPHLELAQATSTRLRGRPLTAAHPNLRGQSDLSFVAEEDLKESDVVFLAVPHGASAKNIAAWSALAPMVVDLSADFRLHDPVRRERHYPGAAPDEVWLSRFRPGIPELHREELRGASHISVPGCMANAAILALHPLAAAGLVEGPALIDARTGSSGGGRTPDEGSHHPERSGALRMAKPHGHRHTAEIEQACEVPVHMTVTGIEAVRGIQVACHITPSRAVTEREVWALYRAAYRDEPFVRLVRERSALRRIPDPKILSGTNYCDIGLSLNAEGDHLIVVSAIDNLVKGGAGNAVQCFNIAVGHDETAGLAFAGLHPA